MGKSLKLSEIQHCDINTVIIIIQHNICCLLLYLDYIWNIVNDSDDKESACDAGDLGLIPGSRRSLGEGNGYPPQYSCLENSMDSPWGRKELDTTE